MADDNNIANKKNTLGNDTSVANAVPEVSIEKETIISQLESMENDLRRIAPGAGEATATHEHFQDAEHIAKEIEGARISGSAGGLGAALAEAQHASSHAHEEKKDEKAKLNLKRINTAAAYAVAVTAAANYGGIDVPFSFMSPEAAQEFATTFISGIGGLQDQYGESVANYLADTGLDDALSDTTVEYLQTANIAAASQSAEEHMAALAQNATPEQRELIESISDKLNTIKRGEDDKNTAFANGDAYQEAVDAALAKNPELIEAMGGREAALKVINDSLEDGDNGATPVERLAATQDALTKAEQELSTMTDPDKRASQQEIIDIYENSIQTAEQSIALTDAVAAEKITITQRNTQERVELLAMQGIFVDTENMSPEQLTEHLQRVEINVTQEQNQLLERAAQKEAEKAVEGVQISANNSEQLETTTITKAGTPEQQALAALAVNPEAFNTDGLAQQELKAKALNETGVTIEPNETSISKEDANATLAAVAQGKAEEVATIDFKDVDASVIAGMPQQEKLEQIQRS